MMYGHPLLSPVWCQHAADQGDQVTPLVSAQILELAAGDTNNALASDISAADLPGDTKCSA